jgi:dienelactone hydrolase
MARALGTLLLAALLGGAADAQVTLVRPARGNPFLAAVWEEAGDTVRLNHYRTHIRSVVHGTESIPRKSVKGLDPDPDPHRRFWLRAREITQSGPEGWHALALAARAEKRLGLARHALVEALVRDPGHQPSRRELGGELERVLAAAPHANPALRERLQAYLAQEDAAARAAQAAELARIGSPFTHLYLERARRSSRERKGRTEDRLLSVDSRVHAGGVYTLYVPSGYDPLRPTPLLLGLHGGGAGGKDRTGVVGSGASAMNFLESAAERRGVLVACPTALRAPWSAPENDPFLLAVLAEVQALFNVDLNRVYLAGHSMGGFGAWHYGVQYAHLWAAISPNAGGGRPNLARLLETKTGVYCYHGADDEVVGPGSDRATAAEMRDKNVDFVYCELPDSGHGWPDEVREEMWSFFELRRLAVAPRRAEKGSFAVTEEPFSSFLLPEAPREVAAFGPLLAPAAGGESIEKQLLSDLEAGGGRAARAAAELGQRRDARLATRVAKVLANPKLTADARRFAAEALGSMGQAEALAALRKAAADEILTVASAAALAAGRLRDPEAPKTFRTAVLTLADSFDKKKSGRSMDFLDYEAHLGAAAEIAAGIGAAANAAAAPALGILMDRLLDPNLQIPTSERAGQDAAPPRRRLAGAIRDAARRLPGEAALGVLSKLAARSDLGLPPEEGEPREEP